MFKEVSTVGENISPGAGILPISKKDGNIYFLFGKEYELNLWSDFGGKLEKNEDVFSCAIREGYEESNGFLDLDYNTLYKTVNRSIVTTIESKNYKSFIFLTEYHELLPYFFNNNFNFIKDTNKHVICQNGYFEKSEIKWFTIDDIKNNKSLFRNWYVPFINEIIDNYDSLVKLI